MAPAVFLKILLSGIVCLNCVSSEERTSCGKRTCLGLSVLLDYLTGVRVEICNFVKVLNMSVVSEITLALST